MEDYISILKKHISIKGQASVARELGYSPSTVNQILKGTYQGKLDNVIKRIQEIYTSETVDCPVLGEISRKYCGNERKKEFAPSNPIRARLYHACKECTFF